MVTGECRIVTSAPSPPARADTAVQQERPWTGAEVRDAEPFIFVLLVLLICGLLARTVAPAKAAGMSPRDFMQIWWEHTFGIAEEQRGTLHVAAHGSTVSREQTRNRECPNCNPEGLYDRPCVCPHSHSAVVDSEAPSTPRPPVFVFNNGSGSSSRGGAGGGSMQRRIVTESGELSGFVSENPLHDANARSREEDDL